jgi:hypothetical protein
MSASEQEEIARLKAELADVRAELRRLGEQHAKEFVDRVVGDATLQARIMELETQADSHAGAVVEILKSSRRGLKLAKATRRAIKEANRNSIRFADMSIRFADMLEAVNADLNGDPNAFDSFEPADPDDPFNIKDRLGEPI